MKINRVCLLGGSGFVGRHLTFHLAQHGIASRILTRHPHRHSDLVTALNTELVSADLFNLKKLTEQFSDCQAVINLVGILNEGKSEQTFRRMHVELPDLVVDACREAGINRLLHMSALNADEAAGSSQYLRSKGEGENRTHTRGQPEIAVTSFRPSVIFGPDDSFVNRFASLLRLPGPLPLACPDAKFAPVYVGDVARAFCRALHDPSTAGQHYELCGPEVYTLQQLVSNIAGYLGVHKHIIPLPGWASRLQAQVLQFVPGKPFTVDNYLSMRLPSVCQEDGLAQLNLTPTHMDAVVPQFLRHLNNKGRLDRLRRRKG